MLTRLINIIENPMKSLIATITGTVTGYIPNTILTITNSESYALGDIFQIIVWTLTIIVALTSIISWCQKQRDRWIKRNSEKCKNIPNCFDEDDDY